jgi:hypothetical protein
LFLSWLLLFDSIFAHVAFDDIIHGLVDLVDSVNEIGRSGFVRDSHHHGDKVLDL